jgi:hypothetical protein
MNTVVNYHESGLTHPSLHRPRAAVRPAWLTRSRLRGISSDIALIVGLLSFVATFAALRFTLFAPPALVEGVLIPTAAGAAVLCVLALLCAFALRDDAPRRPDATAIPPRRTQG